MGRGKANTRSPTAGVAGRLKKHGMKNEANDKKGSLHKNGRSVGQKGSRQSSHGVAAFATRCSPLRLQKLCQILTAQQANLVKEMGFGTVFDVKCRIERVLCLELVNALDITKMCIFVKGEPIPLTYHDVGMVFGLPASGLEIPTSVTEEQKLLLKDFEGVTDGQLEQMIRQGNVDDSFRRAFILYVMSGFFCPTSKMAPSPKLFGAIVDVQNVKKYNWSRFIFDWLVVQITSYKSSHRKTGSIGGCLFFLMIIYLHRPPLAAGDPTSTGPLLAYWDEEMVRSRIRNKRNLKQGILYRTRRRGELCDEVWLKKTYKTEIVQDWVVAHLQMLKDMDDAILAGKYDAHCFVPNLPNFKEAEPASNEKKKVEGFHSDIRDDPSHSIGKGQETMLLDLYTYCTQPGVASENLVSMFGQYLDRHDARTLGPGGWISNYVVTFAAAIFNQSEQGRKARGRYFLPSYFMEKVAHGLEAFRRRRHQPWDTLPTGFGDLQSVIASSNLVFAPIVFDHHWWCYAFNRGKKRLYVLDSLEGRHKGDKAHLDKLAATRFKEMLALAVPTLNPNEVELRVDSVLLPKQKNSDDCGLYTIKYMEMWDGVTTYEGGSTMPDWTEDESERLRRELLTSWVLDKRNVCRAKVAHDAGVDALLSMASPFAARTPSGADVSSYHMETPIQASPSIANRDVQVYEDNAKGVDGEDARTVKTQEKPKSTVATRVKTYGRKRKPALTTRTPYTPLRHLRPRK